MKNLRRHPFVPLVVLVCVLVGYCFWAYRQPLPNLKPVAATTLPEHNSTASLNWPGSQAAVGIVGSPVLEKHGLQVSVPTASTAKIITALMVLQKKPLQPGQQGPTITLTQADVDLYSRYLAQDGSVVPVQVGERITEYQALQALMLPSANNLADTLAIWAYGSLPNYAQAANTHLSSLGLSGTKIGSDASGLAPDTVSTAQDLVKIGELAMENPVLSRIVGQETASGIPVVGSVQNVNFLLGTANIIGVKTGNSDQAGGVFVSASKVTVGNKPQTIVTAIMGTPDLTSALRDSLPLVRSAQSNFEVATVIQDKNTRLGKYTLPWGGSVDALTSSDFSLQIWKGTKLKPKVKLNDIPASTKARQVVGLVEAGQTTLSDNNSDPIVLSHDVPQPTLWWRLTHPGRN